MQVTQMVQSLVDMGKSDAAAQLLAVLASEAPAIAADAQIGLVHEVHAGLLLFLLMVLKLEGDTVGMCHHILPCFSWHCLSLK
jgi:hypothetical protein